MRDLSVISHEAHHRHPNSGGGFFVLLRTLSELLARSNYEIFYFYKNSSQSKHRLTQARCDIGAFLFKNFDSAFLHLVKDLTN